MTLGGVCCEEEVCWKELHRQQWAGLDLKSRSGQITGRAASARNSSALTIVFKLEDHF